MPNIFDGIRKMSDEDVRLEIALITQTNLLNAAKETVISWSTHLQMQPIHLCRRSLHLSL